MSTTSTLTAMSVEFRILRGPGCLPLRRRQLRESKMFYGVLCNNGPAHRLREGDFIQEHPGLLRRLERIICGKHYALMSQCGDGAVERLGRAHARRGHKKILLEIM